jgi:hypothetical protein
MRYGACIRESFFPGEKGPRPQDGERGFQSKKCIFMPCVCRYEAKLRS